jgi:hypothetical protein
VRVDVTADGGKVWHVAHFTGQDTKSRSPYHWGWTLWKAEIPIPSGEKQVRDVRFEIFIVVTMKNAIFWEIKTQFVPHTLRLCYRAQAVNAL